MSLTRGLFLRRGVRRCGADAYVCRVDTCVDAALRQRKRKDKILRPWATERALPSYASRRDQATLKLERRRRETQHKDNAQHDAGDSPATTQLQGVIESRGVLDAHEPQQNQHDRIVIAMREGYKG